jgi:steroid delta-isomerase
MSTPLSHVISGLKFQYENCKPETISQLLAFYAPHAIFRDPFQEVSGHAAISKIFSKMFDQLNTPRFIVEETLVGQNSAAILWEFRFSMKRWNTQEQSFKGVSWLYFDEAGLIQTHHDYWDPAAGIYEKLPIIGPVMRGLKSLA